MSFKDQPLCDIALLEDLSDAATTSVFQGWNPASGTEPHSLPVDDEPVVGLRDNEKCHEGGDGSNNVEGKLSYKRPRTKGTRGKKEKALASIAKDFSYMVSIMRGWDFSSASPLGVTSSGEGDKYSINICVKALGELKKVSMDSLLWWDAILKVFKDPDNRQIFISMPNKRMRRYFLERTTGIMSDEGSSGGANNDMLLDDDSE